MAQICAYVTPLIIYLCISLVHPESTCENSKKEQGICVSTWDCIRQDGRRLGICAKGYIFGVCCSLHKIRSSPFESSVVINKSVISTTLLSSSASSPSQYLRSHNATSNSKNSATNDSHSRHSIKSFITTRPTIDPFAEIVTTVRPVRTVKILNRENVTIVPLNLSSTSSNNFSLNSSAIPYVKINNSRVSYISDNPFDMKDNNNIVENEILIESTDKTSLTTPPDTAAQLTCCGTDNSMSNVETTTVTAITKLSPSTSSTLSNSSSPAPLFSSVILANSNTRNNNNKNNNNKNNSNDTSVTTVTNSHPTDMHKYSSTQNTIESTGETVDTDNPLSYMNVSTLSVLHDVTTVTLSPELNDSDTKSSSFNVDDDSNSTALNDNIAVIADDSTISIVPEKDATETVTQVETGATVVDSTTTVTPSPSPTGSSVSLNRNKTSSLNSTKISTDRPYVSHLDCGVRPLNPYARVVGGRNAQFGEWPWQVLIKESTWLGLFVKTKCGGVLVDHKWVLTAAHCRPGFLGKLVVIVGEYDLTGDFEKLKPVVKQVKRMVVHRDYNPETFENDIALLELESKFEVQPHVIPICLPEATSREEYVGKIGHVAGWGKLSFGGPVPSILQVVKLPVIPNSQCQRMFLTAGHHKIIRNTFLCAGYNDGGKDSCEGDSGGPLMIQEEDGRWTLIGTVSHGIKCAEPNLPGVYMRTSAYRPWIDSIIRSDSHTYKSYTVNVA